MKNYTKFFGYALLFISIITLLDSCKKSPEDPFLSFRSRKQRVVNDWIATEYTVNGVDQLVDIDYDTIPLTSVCVQTNPDDYNRYGVTTTTLTPYLTFYKNGNYNSEFVTDVAHKYDYEIDTAALCEDFEYNDDPISLVTSGSWVFGGDVGEYKNKEQIVITEPKNEVSYVWNIIKLKEKLMKIERTYQEYGTGTEQTFVVKMTLEPRPE